ncbi:hypothetical protein IRP63_14265 (plasmid) [Clostridium botulinum]|uniref:Uncharacterized protein n=1 Tax=Clostridium botulinum C/D str. DC5 TaxID=1443128 RepID=A0A0A0HW91_CLOBO|nr:hypothetical protein [Clostridium botulinum]KGM93444.1 hypothetical protein Z955_14950 [Clostridium botulinum C/D str. DC5]KOC56849.1 hypothetical protein ADU89_01210 [Clostridium botulinum]KOC57324.1 hypothetical protein ADU90_05750 [Clostridium botulinum]MCD3232552.1 hypothetical protein [Clostridium botulinum D/C]MCD3238519.1 hypothetical protein [Clostridium botulinum D/C]
MLKNSKILRGIIICVLLICTIYLVYSIISNPFGQDNIMLAIATAAGFILLGTYKNGGKDKQ